MLRSLSTKLLLLAFFFFAEMQSNSQDVKWTKAFFAGTKCESIEKDSNLNLYFAGIVNDTTALFNHYQLLKKEDFIEGTNAVYIVKTDEDYNIEWSKLFFSQQFKRPIIHIDKENNLLFCAEFYKYFTIGDSTFTGFETKRNQTLVAKFNSDGDLLWYNIISGHPGGYTFNSDGLTTDSDGSVYVAGNGSSSVTFYTNSFKDTIPYVSDTQSKLMYISKFNNKGEFEWCKIPTAGQCQVYLWDIEVDNLKNIYITGWWYSGTIDKISKISPHSDIFLAKINSSLDVEWLQQTGAYYNDVLEFGKDIEIDEDLGAIYLTGGFTGTADFGGQTISANDKNMFLARYDMSGKVRWVKNMGYWSGAASWVESGDVLEVDDAGMIYLGSKTNYQADFNGIILENANDFFIAKYTPLGEVLWVTDVEKTDDYSEIKQILATNDTTLNISGWSIASELFGYLPTGFGIYYPYDFAAKLIFNDKVFKVSKSYYSFKADAYLTDLIEIVSNSDWTLYEESEWIQTNSNSGSGSKIIEFTVDTNNTSSPRTAQINLVSKDERVIQITVQQVRNENIAGIDNLTANKNLSFYPNPVNNVITFNEDIRSGQVIILDMAGNVVMNQSLNGNILDVCCLKSGMYLITINTKDNSNTFKFIKN